MRPEQDVRGAAGCPRARRRRNSAPKALAPKRRGARRVVVAVVIVAVCALVGFGGLMVYAGTGDAFCMEACHTPMEGSPAPTMPRQVGSRP